MMKFNFVGLLTVLLLVNISHAQTTSVSVGDAKTANPLSLSYYEQLTAALTNVNFPSAPNSHDNTPV